MTIMSIVNLVMRGSVAVFPGEGVVKTDSQFPELLVHTPVHTTTHNHTLHLTHTHTHSLSLCYWEAGLT